MARKRLNKNVVIALTLFAFAMIVVLSVLMLWQLQRRDPKYFVEHAEEAARQQQWVQAALFYRKAWEQSDDATYLVGVGEMLLNQGEVGQALGSWEQALVRQPDLLDAHMNKATLLLELAELYSTPREWTRVRDAATAMLELETDRTDEQTAFALHAQGSALVRLADQDSANVEAGLAKLQHAAELAPDVVEYATDLANQYFRNDQPERADELYVALLERHASAGPSGAKAQLAYARYLAAKREFDRAETAYKTSLSLATDDEEAFGEAQMGYASFLLQQWARARRDDEKQDQAKAYLDESEELLKQRIADNPDEFEPYVQLALLYKLSARFDQVVETCESRLSQGLSRKGVRASRNKVSTFTLMLYASEACVAKGLAATNAGDMDGRERWLARADQYVLDAKGESPSHPRILSQSGRVKLARGNDREALEDLRAADERYESFGAVNWDNKIILANAHLRLNEAGAAKDLLEAVVDRAIRQRAGDPIFWNLYAQALFQTENLGRALAVVDRVLQFDAKNVNAMMIKAAIYERQDKPELAGRLHEQITGSSTVRAMLEARAASIDNDVEKSLRILRTALEKEPADTRLVGMTVHELLSADRSDEALAVANKAIKVRPDDIALKQLVVIARQDLTDEQRREAMLEVIDAEPDAFKRALDLVMFHSRQDDAEHTLKAIDDALTHLIARDTPFARTAKPSQHRALLRTKLRVAAQLDDTEAMEAARNVAAQYNVDGAGGKSILALYHVQRREFDLAINALREAIEAQPSDASSLTLLGQCLHMMGRTDEARDAYERAVRVNHDEGLAHKGLALLAGARNDNATLQSELASCERLIPTDPWVQEQVIIQTENADPQGAISRREEQLATKPDDARNLKRLASLYETVGQRDHADATHARLLELNPGDERIIVSAAGYFRRTDQPDRAISLLTAHADTRATPSERAGAMRLVAQEQIAQGDVSGAEKTLLAAADIAGTIEVWRAIAEFYMKTVQQPERTLPWYDRAIDDARRSDPQSLPGLLEERVACLLHRNVNDIEGARRDVDDLRTNFPDFARGHLWDSEIHARTGEIDKAIASLSVYLTARPGDSYALYQRARHLLSKGATTSALDDLLAIKRTSPLALRLEPRILLARIYHRSGRDDLWIRELEAIAQEAPSSGFALEELATAYLKLQRLDGADRLVTAQINRATEKPEARWFFLRGRISLQLEDHDKALEDFQQAARAGGFTPTGVARVLNLFAQLERFEAGVDYYTSLSSQVEQTALIASRYARLLAGANRPEQSVDAFRRAMAAAAPDARDIIGVIADDLYHSFPPDQAIDLFRNAPTTPATTQANQRLLVRLSVKTRRYDDAFMSLDQLIADTKDDAEHAAFLHEKGDVLQLADRTDEAIASYEEALKYNADSWVTLNNVAYLLSDRKGDATRALPYAQRAVAIADNSFTLDTLGWIYVGLRQYSLAIAELSRAIRLDPDYAWSYYHLGEAHRRVGQFSEATDVLSSGREAARAMDDTELRDLINESVQRTAQRDRNP